MNGKFSIVKSLVVAAALVAGASGMARADDSSMSRSGRESDAHFNQPASNVSADSAWRQSHPNGLSERDFQALSSWGPAWDRPNQSATSALWSTNDAANMPTASREPFGARVARFFHVTPANRATPAN